VKYNHSLWWQSYLWMEIHAGSF